mmetsp:Transcript_28753/g.75466  ORF Transcript_28753/g.75466 Transcript_28753/m.75466 type:complete len:247 (-) Transcript_28753:5-745(-)
MLERSSAVALPLLSPFAPLMSGAGADSTSVPPLGLLPSPSTSRGTLRCVTASARRSADEPELGPWCGSGSGSGPRPLRQRPRDRRLDRRPQPPMATLGAPLERGHAVVVHRGGICSQFNQRDHRFDRVVGCRPMEWGLSALGRHCGEVGPELIHQGHDCVAVVLVCRTVQCGGAWGLGVDLAEVGVDGDPLLLHQPPEPLDLPVLRHRLQLHQLLLRHPTVGCREEVVDRPEQRCPPNEVSIHHPR